MRNGNIERSVAKTKQIVSSRRQHRQKQKSFCCYREGLYDRDGECELVSRCQHGELIGTDNGFMPGQRTDG